MSNIVKMEVQESIRALKRQGWSDHRISREPGVNRRTVKRYGADSKCTNPQTGKKGPASACEGHREQITQCYEHGLSVERIHRDLSVNLQAKSTGNVRVKVYHLGEGKHHQGSSAAIQ